MVHVVTGWAGRRNSVGRTWSQKVNRNISVHSFPDPICSKWLFALRTSAARWQSRRAVWQLFSHYTSHHPLVMWGDKILEPDFGEKLVAGYRLRWVRFAAQTGSERLMKHFHTRADYRCSTFCLSNRYLEADEGVDRKRQTKSWQIKKLKTPQTQLLWATCFDPI